MTSWIVAIDKNYPQHWRIAIQHGFWDMTHEKPITAGDDVYFWQAGKSFVGQTRATSDVRPLQPGDKPWEDTGVRDYRWRFDFGLVSNTPTSQPRWGEVAQATGIRQSLQSGIVATDDREAEAWLTAVFKAAPAPASMPDVYLSHELRLEVDELLGHDLRERTLRAIALRQGQPAFRSALIDAYAGTCAVTGYRTESVLEAAHISPYLGHHTNAVTNGLLLRADIHTLFDRHLVTVTPDHVVRVAPTLGDTPYRDYNWRLLAVVPSTSQRPSRRALAAHNGECPWLEASATSPAGPPRR